MKLYWFICLFKGDTFPVLWKIGNVVIIPKRGDKDPNDLKICPPICLGQNSRKKSEGLSNKQLNMGFVMAGPLTDDAVCQLIDTIQNCEAKYAVGLLLDISGSLDNFWWPGH